MTDERSRETPSDVLKVLRAMVRAPTKKIVEEGAVVYPSVCKSTIYALLKGKTGMQRAPVWTDCSPCAPRVRAIRGV